MPSRHFYRQTCDGCLERKDGFSMDTDLSWDSSMPFLSSSDGPGSSRTSQSENSETTGDGCIAQSLDADLDTPFGLDEFAIDMLPLHAPSSPTLTAHPDFPVAYMDPNPRQEQDRTWMRSYNAYPYPNLSDIDVQTLLRIAMPQPRAAMSSDEPQQDDGVEEPCETSKSEVGRPARKQKPKPLTISEKARRKDYLSKKQKKSHNMIEKRYRTNLNDKLAELQQTVPSLQNKPEGEQPYGDAQKTQDEAPYMYRKAVIITQAIEYIGYLESSTLRLSSETTTLKAQLAVFKKQIDQMEANVLRHSAASSQMPIAETLEAIQDNFTHIQAGKRTKTGTEMKRKTIPRHAKRGDSIKQSG